MLCIYNGLKSPKIWWFTNIWGFGVIVSQNVLNIAQNQASNAPAHCRKNKHQNASMERVN